MKSEFADKFNHDEDAPDYDQDVRNEADPIRAGYDALLNWVAAQTGTARSGRILELGSGNRQSNTAFSAWRRSDLRRCLARDDAARAREAAA